MVSENNQQSMVIIRGRAVTAVYRKPECPDHEGNPLIEALPPILNDDQAAIRLAYYPKYDETQRKAPAHIRYLLIQNGLKFFAPLDIHIDLQRRFSNLLRVGYTRRNPMVSGFWGEIASKRDSFDQYEDQYERQPDRLPSTAAGFNIIGPSGVGKSFSVERILSLTPQVVHHGSYRGRNFTHSQLVWLKLDCPFDGNPRGLCTQFFKAVDSIISTDYYRSYVKQRRIQDELLSDMATVAANHLLGVLVIDEIQRLSLAKSGGADRMLNFFVQLINDIGVPVVLIGNYKAMSVLSGDFSQMRRGTGQGDLIWDLMEKDKQWELFVESLWRFQYTKKKCTATSRSGVATTNSSETLSDVLYEESQGITDFAVKTYMFAQERAIDSGKEVVTAPVIRSAAKDKLRVPREVLQALKIKDRRVLEQYEDLYSSAFKNYPHQPSTQGQAAGQLQDGSKVGTLLKESGQLNAENTFDILPAERMTRKTGAVQATDTANRKAPLARKGCGLSHSKVKGELPKLLETSKAQNGTTAYEALREQGHIRPISEYIPAEQFSHIDS